ncbi:hypothetical protein ACPTGR_14875, partial [Enterococcus faecium]
HYVGSLKTRVAMQADEDNQLFVMIAVMQALTDNAKNPEKVSSNVLQVAFDYLAVGFFLSLINNSEPTTPCLSSGVGGGG